MRDPVAMKAAGTSISGKLKDTAKAQGLDPDFLFKKFGIERLLARLNESPYAGLYCVKGGMIMLLANPEMPRATEDLDFTAFAPFDKDTLLEAFRAVAAVVPSREDGITFVLDEVRASKDTLQREDAENPGFRLFVDGQMQTHSRPVPLRVKIDAAYGEAIVPGPVQKPLSPTIRGWEPPVVPVYPWETVLAEKLHAICKRGLENTRLRDFYDILAITRWTVLDGSSVVRSIVATFETRASVRPDPDARGLSPEFAEIRQADWTSLMSKKGIKLKLPDFVAVVAEAAAFARPMLAAARDGTEFDVVWTPGRGWVAEAPEALPPAL